MDCEVLVVGAGPTGLVLALELARRGVKVRVADKADGSAVVGRAVGIQARTLEIFEDLGILELILSMGVKVTVDHCYVDRRLARSTLADSLAPEGVPFPWLLALEQGLVERVLASHLARHEVFVDWNSPFGGLRQDDYGVTAQVGGRSLRCAYLVACDGARSAVREELGLGFPGKGYPFVFQTADVAVEWQLPYEQSYTFWKDGAPLGMMPIMKPNRFRIWAQVGEQPVSSEISHGFLGDDPSPPLEDLQRLADAMIPGQVRLTDSRFVARYRVDCRLAESFRRGRCFLAGDAAHVHPASTFQGMNTGIGDAHNLGWKLARTLRHSAAPGLLDSYESERRPVAATVLEEADRALLAPLEKATRKIVHGRFFEPWWQLQVNYRHTHTDRVGKSPVQAGDRAPDGLLEGTEGTFRLHSLLCGADYVTLAFLNLDSQIADLSALLPGCDIYTIGERGDFLDPGGRLRRLYGLPRGGLVLIRPDGHVAGRAPLEEPEWLAQDLL